MRCWEKQHNDSIIALLRQVFITPFGMLQFMDRLGDPTLKTLTKAVDTMRASMLSVIQVSDMMIPSTFACCTHSTTRFNSMLSQHLMMHSHQH
jgi:hypothetical protein